MKIIGAIRIETFHRTFDRHYWLRSLSVYTRLPISIRGWVVLKNNYHAVQSVHTVHVQQLAKRVRAAVVWSVICVGGTSSAIATNRDCFARTGSRCLIWCRNSAPPMHPMLLTFLVSLGSANQLCTRRIDTTLSLRRRVVCHEN